MVIIVVVAIIEDIECAIFFIADQYLVRIDFFAYGKVVCGGIVELIHVVIRQETVGISVVTYAVVVRRGIRNFVVTSRVMVGIVFVVG